MAISVAGFAPKSIAHYLASGAIVFASGWLLGSMLVGGYLLLALNQFNMHHNEAFSALRAADYKGFPAVSHHR